MRSLDLATLCFLVVVQSVTSCGGESTAPRPARLVFTVQASGATAGAPFASAPQVTVQDAQGNAVSSPTSSVTIALSSGTGTTGAHLRGPTTIGAASGVAVFNGLSIDSVGTGYLLTASASGLPTVSSAPFAVTPAPAQALGFAVQPSDAVAATAISPAIRVVVRDSIGNTVKNATDSVTVAITAGTGSSGAVLSGNRTQAAASGIATFNNLSIDKVGGYTLTATAGGLLSGLSSTFSIHAGTATKLTFVVQPTDVVAGSSITPAVQVVVQDAQGNTVTSATTSITVAIGTSPGGGALSGTTTGAAVAGVATFPNLSIDKVGTGYTLKATASGLTGATSGTFNITVGAANKLVFTVQPSRVARGAAITPAVEVRVQDSQGNTVPTASNAITLAVAAGTGTPGAVLSGTQTELAVSGVATFGDLAIDRLGAGFGLAATSPGLVGASSAGFTVSGVATQVVVGESYTCVLANDRLVYCWGYNTAGQLGDGTATNHPIPAPISGGQTFTQVVAGLYHTCGITATAFALCWGYNTSGELGDGTTTGQWMPVSVIGMLTFTQLAAGHFHTCGLTTAGVAYCWGQASKGQLGIGGDGSQPDRSTQVAVSSGLVFVQLSAGRSHTCGIANSSLAYCWGYNFFGQLGLFGSYTDQYIPIAVSGGLSFTQLTSGDIHTCAIAAGGSAYCWGDNANGQLGYPIGRTYSPVPVVGGLTFTQISAGYTHTCGVTSGGSAYCWGNNGWGQLGNGTTTQADSPVGVSGGIAFIQVTAGDTHTCGLTSGGAVYCWGENDKGQLGDGTTTNRLAPVRVSVF